MRRSRVEELEALVKELLQRTSLLETRVVELETENARLRADNRRLKRENRKLGDENRWLRQEVRRLGGRLVRPADERKSEEDSEQSEGPPSGECGFFPLRHKSFSQLRIQRIRTHPGLLDVSPASDHASR